MSRKAEWQRAFRQGERHLSWKRPCRYRSGQATVEAAFLIPLILLLLMLLMQPGIILYSRMVMQVPQRKDAECSPRAPPRMTPLPMRRRYGGIWAPCPSRITSTSILRAVRGRSF